MYHLNNIDKNTFLKEYWQKKPLIIKQGLANFVDPLDEHDLAGLAQEDDIDSRIVSFDNNAWQVSHGPFEDINAACLGAWSLLVQSVDHFVPEADQLMRAFDFIPHWRMDDLMVSYSNQGAGVGPHTDQYDVFIIQGKGTRRWQVGLPADHQVIKPHKDLSQITGFVPIIDEVLSPGDIVYIPPNHPHNGVALEECINYSVGFRAPSAQHMLTSFADYAIENQLLTELYQDNGISAREYSGEINQQEVRQFKLFLQQVINTEHFEQWLPSFMSQSKAVTDNEEQENAEYDHQYIQQMLTDDVCFYRSPAIKPVFVDQMLTADKPFDFFIEGQKFSVPSKEATLVKIFLSSEFIQQSVENNYLECSPFTQLLTELVNLGFWYPE